MFEGGTPAPILSRTPGDHALSRPDGWEIERIRDAQAAYLRRLVRVAGMPRRGGWIGDDLILAAYCRLRERGGAT